jgi:filamentous hemagglutinin
MDRSLSRALGNSPTSIYGRGYSSHAVDGMQNAGIFPTVVENTILTGTKITQANGNIKYYDAINDISVITNETGRVITTFWGGK